MRKKRKIILWLNIQSKWKVISSLLMILLLGFIFMYELPASKTWTYWTLPLSGKTIVIDAGHGGPDGGASSKEGVIEKDITLAISLHLRDYLQQAGALVLMTREADHDLAEQNTRGLRKRKVEDLHNRSKFVQESGADMLLSIHLNAIPSERWYGAQTFYTKNHEGNQALATLIQEELKRTVVETDRVAKSLDKTVYLLKESQIPSSLIEVGFLSNPEEARKLATETYQKQLAAAIYQGVLRYVSGEKIGSP
ncbi:N-acetylmuramoyl-L-alanine amidase CwlD [Paenibacillus turpanensis]|uniref:N-acetylmuramoyl-L-alanine amidase CwlD n=1 Tax=Paenibacillus turpanensis TaxID=2689078 RepID=UPI001409DF4B|nr:N-acetylmuramoyl-L-alanine amidase CwlD [Paenibacillus turpanensis]